jgi:hypothetical protein
MNKILSMFKLRRVLPPASRSVLLWIALTSCAQSSQSSDAKAKADSEAKWGKMFEHMLDSIWATPTYWPTAKAPDSKSTMHLVTKCVDGIVYYRFWVGASPSVFDRYRRSLPIARKDDALFVAVLLDSAGFNITEIDMHPDNLSVAQGDHIISANEHLAMKCSQYGELSSWTPRWKLVE